MIFIALSAHYEILYIGQYIALPRRIPKKKFFFQFFLRALGLWFKAKPQQHNQRPRNLSLVAAACTLDPHSMDSEEKKNKFYNSLHPPKNQKEI